MRVHLIDGKDEAAKNACVRVCSHMIALVYVFKRVHLYACIDAMYASSILLCSFIHARIRACVRAYVCTYAYMHACRHTDIQTDIQTQTDRQTDRQAGRQADRHMPEGDIEQASLGHIVRLPCICPSRHGTREYV